MPQSHATGATDFLCPYGGGITFDASGSPVLVRDTDTAALATQQRIEVLLFTSPRLFDLDGIGVGRPDDLFHPDYGAGLRALVGRNPSPLVDAGVKARILKALSDDSAVVSSPPPTVTAVSVENRYYVVVTAFTTRGVPFTISRSPGG